MRLFLRYFSLAILLSGCLEESDDTPFISPTLSRYDPLFTTRAELENSFAIQPEQPLNRSGKVLAYQELLFVVDPYRGVHVYDNTNVDNPQKLQFIRVLGIQDIALKENILYADNAVDIIGIDVQDIARPVLRSRLRNVLNEPLSPEGLDGRNIANNEISPEFIIFDYEER